MAVLRRKRAVAFSEFERQMGNLCKELKARLNTLPSRYKKFLSRRIYEPANHAYSAVIIANEQNSRDSTGAKRRTAMFVEALGLLSKLQKPLLSYWNLKDSSEGGMKQVADMVNREYALIYGVMGRKDAPPMIVTLPKRKAKELLFLGKMCELHRYTYQRIGHAPNDCTDFISMQIAEFVDSALCHVVVANHRIPETKEEAERRIQHLTAAVDCLNGMQRPMLALWNLMDYSERIMDEWAGLLDEEIKLLEGLKKADKTRYKDLK